MQLAGTRGGDRRAGHVDAPRLADPRRRRSARRVDLALQARAPGAVGARCSAGRRPGGPAPGGSPDDQQPVQALGADRPHPPLRVRVRLGRPHRRHSTPPPSERNTSSKLRQNFASRSRSRKPYPPALVPQHQQQVPGLLGDPAAVGVGGHAGQVDPPGVQFDEEQHVQPPQPHRLDGEEVAGDDPGGLLAQERPPGASARRGAGSSPWRRSVVRIAVAETRTPSCSSSPLMRW